jgi:dimethylhistidine N-methyltransferase
MSFQSDLLATLPGRINSWWFYDQHGSELFEQITDLPEYYPTRTETALLHRHAADMATQIGPRATLVEYGAGSLTKVRILLDAMTSPLRYKPLDVSGEFLKSAANDLRRDYLTLDIQPIIASFTDAFDFGFTDGTNRVGFFPGSTIGNLDDATITALLRHARALDKFLLGVDLVKDTDTLIAAYNDAQGITARFNLNLLHRANAEAGTDFNLEEWEHLAVWNAKESQIEMHLRARSGQSVTLADQTFPFAKGDTILTEISRKFTPEILAPLFAASGWALRDLWVDPHTPYALLMLD